MSTKVINLLGIENIKQLLKAKINFTLGTVSD